MKKNIRMPKLSEKMESGVLAAWNKEVGERVENGEVLFEIETEKVVSEVESQESGIVEAVCFAAGDEVKVDEIIAVINCD
jgi:pyruvate dehydrogenase E2 component (dihydrolipoamide acetyltransferase)/2-oxoglutarate dehydrogenase E2 component (dihydrolipoamide succinyltransferase)